MADILVVSADAGFRVLIIGTLLTLPFTALVAASLRVASAPGQAMDRVFALKVGFWGVLLGTLSPLFAANVPVWFFHAARSAGNVGMIAAVLFLLWTAGMFISGVRLLRAARRLSATVARAARVEHGPAARLLRALSVEFSIGRRVIVRCSADVSVPFMTGWLRPVVVLPASAPSWSDERLQLVLRHELTHAQRGDWLYLYLLNMLTAILWFHPGLRWLRARYVREIETACDEALVGSGTSAVRYAEHMIAIARESRGELLSSFALPLSREARALERRLTHLLSLRSVRSPALRFRLAAVLLMAATLAGGVTLLMRSACVVSMPPLASLFTL